MGKLHGELRPVLKFNFKERDWIFRLHQQIWPCVICRLKLSKIGYNIPKSKFDFHLHNFRGILLSNKRLSSSNKLIVQWKKYQKCVVFCEKIVVKFAVIFLQKHLWRCLPRRILQQGRRFFRATAATSHK